ncbi:MAG TPA: hypothetical protein VF112_06830 [Candidatus Dormibacteraeota bacterium]
MRRSSLALALVGVAAVTVAWANGLLSLDGARAGTSLTGYLDSTVAATLDEETADGWNPQVSSMYINWGMVDPTLVNYTDHVLTRHDYQNDLRDLENMERYEAQHPGDTSQQAGIQRIYPSVLTEFNSSSSTSGWVYWELLDLGTLTGDSRFTGDAVSMASHYSASIDPNVGVAHGSLTGTTTSGAATCADGYRVDSTLEDALMLVDAGRRFTNSTWTQQGYRAYSVVRSAALDPTYGLYNRIVCQGTLWDRQARVQEQADEARDGIITGEYVGDPSLIADGVSLLDALVGNRSGLHDTVDGGWCPQFDLGSLVLDCHIKTSRQYLLLRAFHDADRYEAGRYAAEESELENLVSRMVTSPHVGFLYERAQDFSLYQGENWISAEADGIVVGALQDVLGDTSGATTSSSTSATTSSATSTATSTTATTTSTASSTRCASAKPRGRCRK